MGAWIEINIRGMSEEEFDVAPLVGAWIEILLNSRDKELILVAPLVGAWIEIPFGSARTNRLSSRSPRGSVD